MINSNYDSSAVACFCIYAPYMLINQHTNQPTAEMQLQAREAEYYAKFAQNQAVFNNRIAPIPQIPYFGIDQGIQNFNQIPTQEGFYPSVVPSQSLLMNVSDFSSKFLG